MIEFKFAKVPAFVKNYQRQLLLSGMVLGSSCVLLLSGCSSSMTNGLRGPSGETVVYGISGKTHGGQFPVSGSSVQVYSVSVASPSGYSSASTPLGTAVTTDSGGSWTYGDFTCASGSDELYVVSSGGNPGLGGSVNNPALVMTAALGPCSNVGNIPFVFIDELTTVATEYALAGFATDYLHIGTSATNTVGLTNAFATVNNLVDITTGQALTTTPAYVTPPSGTVTDTFRSIVPYDLINTIGNVISSCVNTDGSSNPACSNLFSITGGSIAYPSQTITNTADATLYVAHYPGLTNYQGGQTDNVPAFFNLSPPSPPFGPALSAAPNDYTMTVNFVGGGLGGVKLSSESGSQFFAIDQQGNIWVPNPHTATVTELNNLGAPLSPSTTINTSTTAYRPIVLGGYKNNLQNPNHLAIDLNGNAWVSDGVECLAGFDPTGTPLPGSPYTTDCNGTTDQAGAGVGVDASNNIWVETQHAVSAVNGSGTLLPGFPITAGINQLDGFLGPDYTGHMWFIDSGSGFWGAYNTNATLYVESTNKIPYGPNGYVAMGPSEPPSLAGNGGLAMWLTQSDGVQNVQPIDVTGDINTLPFAPIPSSLAGPTGISVDGKAVYYFANFGGTDNTGNIIGANVTVITNNDVQLSTVATGYTGGSALMMLDQPLASHIDQSGNLWVINQNNANFGSTPPAGGTYYGNGVNADNLTEFIGIAAPVNPVYAQDAVNKTYGVLP